MNTNNKGNIGLAKVITALSEKGYSCFLPFTDTTCVDLIVANRSMDTKRIQIKYKKVRKGCVTIKCASVINRKDVPLNKTHIDYFIVYCPDNQKCYYLPITLFENKISLKLRVDDAKIEFASIRYANRFEHFDFELE